MGSHALPVAAVGLVLLAQAALRLSLGASRRRALQMLALGAFVGAGVATVLFVDALKEY